jgi:hypothetical protein
MLRTEKLLFIVMLVLVKQVNGLGRILKFEASFTKEKVRPYVEIMSVRSFFHPSVTEGRRLNSFFFIFTTFWTSRFTESRGANRNFLKILTVRFIIYLKA